MTRRGVIAASPIPLYSQVASVLRSRIVSGIYEPGSPIGTEQELGEAFGVSRITIRQALAALAADGLVDRRRGRGTFVADGVQAEPRVELHGFLDDIILQADFAGTVYVERTEMPADADSAEALGLAVGEIVVRFRRLRARSGTPHAWIVNDVPGDIGADIRAEDLERRSLLEILDGSTEGPLSFGRQHICARAARGEVDTRLEVAEGEPVLAIERVVLNDAGRVVEHVWVWYRDQDYVVRLDRLSRSLAGGPLMS